MKCSREHTFGTGFKPVNAPREADVLFADLYAELKRLAGGHAQRFEGAVTLSPTALVHEAWLQMASGRTLDFTDHAQFLSYASRAIRGILIDYARNRRAEKRGGAFQFTSLDDAQNAVVHHDDDRLDLARLGEAVEELSVLDARLAEVVDLHFFCGFSFEEIASQRGVSERTVLRDWRKARILLGEALKDDLA
ncbi:MAG: sigma-70 family RNA polymerase sigma factor [Gemmatimonadaceae bacterium]|nr:sigma-70 family RNA polymerase sigma factor [Gemmatimonadaceae bacterium]